MVVFYIYIDLICIYSTSLDGQMGQILAPATLKYLPGLTLIHSTFYSTLTTDNSTAIAIPARLSSKTLRCCGFGILFKMATACIISMTNAYRNDQVHAHYLALRLSVKGSVNGLRCRSGSSCTSRVAAFAAFRTANPRVINRHIRVHLTGKYLQLLENLVVF